MEDLRKLNQKEIKKDPEVQVVETGKAIDQEKKQITSEEIEKEKLFEKFLLEAQYNLASEVNKVATFLYEVKSRARLVPDDAFQVFDLVKQRLGAEQFNKEHSLSALKNLSIIFEKTVMGGPNDKNIMMEFMSRANLLLTSLENYKESIVRAGDEKIKELKPLLLEINHTRDKINEKKVRISLAINH